MEQDINALHRKLAPTKYLGNFWKSEDYKTVAKLLESQELLPVSRSTTPFKGTPASTMVHPLVALAFLRWADQAKFYARLNRVFV